MPYWARKLPAVDSIYLTVWKRQACRSREKRAELVEGRRRADGGLIRTDLSKLPELHRAKNSDRTACELKIKKKLNFKECAGQPTGACGALSQGRREAEAGGTVGVLKVLPTFVTLDVGLPALPTAQAAGHTHTHTHTHFFAFDVAGFIQFVKVRSFFIGERKRS